MSSRVPYWVHKRDQAYRDMAHMESERSLQDGIRQLEKENSELKDKIAKLENGLLVALNLLVKST